MKIKLRPAPPEGITGATIIKVAHNNESLRVVYELDNRSILSKTYDYNDDRGLYALSILAQICLGEVEEFESEDLVGCRVKLELSRQVKDGIAYSNIKKILPYDDEEDELEEVDDIDDDESDSDDDENDDDDIEEESDDDDYFEHQSVYQNRRRRNIKLSY